MLHESPDDILFTDKRGKAALLDDVIAEGLDGEYKDRVPALIDLVEGGSPYHRLMACVVLTSWGHPAGFRALTSWASNPHATPWAAEPVGVDRLHGADDAFERLADALKTSYWNAETEALRDNQREAAGALLAVYPDRFFGRTLALALVKDPVWQESRRDRITSTLQSCVQRIRGRRERRFDLPFQTASLLLVLARGDDTKTAALANQLISLCPDNNRMLRELALALGDANGGDTLQSLERLKRLGRQAVTAEVDRVLSARENRR